MAKDLDSELKRALKGQYHAGLAMLREAIEKCPEELWTAGAFPRNTWRIAFHAIFYTHLYLQTEESAFQPWAKGRESIRLLWDDEDGNLPPVEPPTGDREPTRLRQTQPPHDEGRDLSGR